MSDPDIAALERHALGAWPATIARAAPGGWWLRATPGLDRARSNNALTPCRTLATEEIAPAIAQVEAFAAANGIRAGVQVSPLEWHAALDAELAARGYAGRWSVDVLVAEAHDLAAASGDAAPATAALTGEDRASDAWLDAWARAEGRDDAAAHAATVFARLAGRACFARLDGDAVGLAVPGEGLAGVFCVAVDQHARRRGLATALMRGLADAAGEPRLYLQVEGSNTAALALYAHLGFRRAYGYKHRVQS